MKVKFRVKYNWNEEDRTLDFTIVMTIPSPLPEEFQGTPLGDWSVDPFAEFESSSVMEYLGSQQFVGTPEKTLIAAQEEVNRIIKDVLERFRVTKEINTRMRKLDKVDTFEYSV